MARAIRVVSFLLLISLPLLASLLGVDGADPRAEKRELAELPRLDGSLVSALQFPARLSAWFDDHFAFRSALVRCYGEMRFFGFGVSPSASVVKGPNGWLFYATDGGMDDYTREKPFSDTELAEWRDSIVRSNEWLRARGIAYVFVLAPDKHVLYPEELPATIRPVGKEARMDQILRALEGTGVAALDLRPALLEAKARERVFDVTDTHWNARGAFVAYQQVVAAIRSQGVAVPEAWARTDFEPEQREVEGQDLAAMMGLQASLRETELSLRPKQPRVARVLVPAGAAPDAEVGKLITEVAGSELPRAVVFRDSFFSRVAPFLSEHFSRVAYHWQNNFDSKIVSEERASVVVQEIVGRHLMYVSPYSDVAVR
jgi:alginate O-acetyltransferase complex protein AlgJ